MTRTTRPDAFAARRDAILLATQRLLLTSGYAHMSIQDVLSALHISAGAFHHYFDSRGALLDALVERMQEQSGEALALIVDDPDLTPLQKLQACVSTALEPVCLVQPEDELQALRVWYADANALVRQRVDEATARRQAPLLTKIVRQGVREGVFATSFPEHAGGVLTALLRDLRDSHARLRLSSSFPSSSSHAASMEAIERVLGAAPQSLQRLA